MSSIFHPSETVGCWMIILWSALAHILTMNDAQWICSTSSALHGACYAHSNAFFFLKWMFGWCFWSTSFLEDLIVVLIERTLATWWCSIYPCGLNMLTDWSFNFSEDIWANAFCATVSFSRNANGQTFPFRTNAEV